jgi:hypothetical protein
VRSALLYPVFPTASAVLAIRYIWVDSMLGDSIARRILDSLKTLLLSPVWYVAELWRLLRTPKSSPTARELGSTSPPP